MRRAFETWVYGLTMRGDWIASIVARVWFRWYCPVPLSDDWTARRCIADGNCGCNNRLAPTSAMGSEK